MASAWRAITTSRTYKFLKAVIDSFGKNDDMSLAAAVAFYTALSFAPLVMLVATFGNLLPESDKGDLVDYFSDQLGPRASEVAEAVVESAEKENKEASWWRSALGVILLLVSASAVFGQLQASLNRIWSVANDPDAGIWVYLRRRLLSLGMVLVALFILLVSLILSAVVERLVPAGEGIAGRVGLLVVSFIVSALLFAAMFKVLPDADIAWREVWLGAVVTALLFAVGKFLIGLYLGWSGVTESYGQAASGLIALLVWVYYSTVILLLGAEITRHTTHHAPVPVEGAVKVKKAPIAQRPA